MSDRCTPNRIARLTLAATAATMLASTVMTRAPAAFADDTATILVVPQVPVGPLLEANASGDDPVVGQLRASLASVKATAAADIAKRQVTLGPLAGRVNGSGADCGQNAAMTAQIGSTQQGLAALGSTIAADTDLAKAQSDRRRIFGDFRVYLLVAPKSSIVRNCNNHLNYANRLRAEAQMLATRISEEKAKGRDTSAAEIALRAALGAIDPAIGQDVNAVATVIGLVPDRGDANLRTTNSRILAAAHSAERAGDAMLDSARAQLRAGFSALRAARPVTIRKSAGNPSAVVVVAAVNATGSVSPLPLATPAVVVTPYNVVATTAPAT